MKARRRRLKRNRNAQSSELVVSAREPDVPARDVVEHAPLDLVAIPWDEVDEIWPLGEEFINAGCAAGEADPETLKLDCENGYAQFWLAWSDHCEAAAVTRIIETPNGLVCVYEAMGAKSLRRSNKEVAPKIEQWAKAQGCIAVRIYGRPGWSRAMPDYTLRWVCMDKGL